MAIRAPLILPALSSLLLLTSCLLTIADAEGLLFETISLDVLLPSTESTTPRAVAARQKNSVEIVGRKTAFTREAHHAVFDKDSLRVASLQKRVLNASMLSVQANGGLNIGAADHGITVGIGSPATDQIVLFDTSSDVCWIQCMPCVAGCYPQSDPIFNSSLSATYGNVSCNSTICKGLASNRCYSKDTCAYEVSYANRSYSTGFFASDRLKLQSGHEFNDFLFGCGQGNTGFLKGYAGLLGLGRNRYSLNSQLAFKFGNIFSYCLHSKGSQAAYLRLGEPPTISTGYTPMISDPKAPSLYFLNLTGITVSGKELDIPPSTFQSAKTIIDSGTEITRLPSAVYNALKMAFQASMTDYPEAEPFGVMDTCYNLRDNPMITYPMIRLQFYGRDVTLHASGVLYAVSSSQVCLAFAGNSDASQLTIIGNVQQRTIEITYDVDQELIGFSEGSCD